MHIERAPSSGLRTSRAREFELHSSGGELTAGAKVLIRRFLGSTRERNGVYANENQDIRAIRVRAKKEKDRKSEEQNLCSNSKHPAAKKTCAREGLTPKTVPANLKANTGPFRCLRRTVGSCPSTT